MQMNRREFVGTMLIGAVASSARGASAMPLWVPPGYPPFYEDEAFGHLIVHKDVDLAVPDYHLWHNNGGDTAQREGFTWFGLWLLQNRGIQPVVSPSLPWSDAVALLEDPKNPGLFRRHPDPSQPQWSDVMNFSRDQQTPLVAALGALGPRATLDRLWAQFDGRGRVCQNGDSGGPDHQNLFFRARGQGTIESFGEFQLVTMVESIAIRGTANPDDVGDDLNFLVALMAAHELGARPTKTSEAALCEYLRTRPLNYGCYLERYRQNFKDFVAHDLVVDRIKWLISRDPRPECHPSIGALRWYFNTETGAGWGPAAIWEQVVTDVLTRVRCAI
jgi:hypothetical protein